MYLSYKVVTGMAHAVARLEYAMGPWNHDWCRDCVCVRMSKAILQSPIRYCDITRLNSTVYFSKILRDKVESTCNSCLAI